MIRATVFEDRSPSASRTLQTLASTNTPANLPELPAIAAVERISLKFHATLTRNPKIAVFGHADWLQLDRHITDWITSSELTRSPRPSLTTPPR
jgi:hypothetical protein